MKQLLGIILLILLLVPATATFLYLYWRKLEIREEVKEQMIDGLEEDQLVLLKFTEADAHRQLRWEHAGEFEYQRQMYDIVRRELKGDTTYYYCWLDKAETQLNRQLEQLVAEVCQEEEPHERSQYIRLFDFFQTLYCSRIPSCQDLEAVPVRTFFQNALNYYALSFPPPVPPPRLG